MQQNQPMNILSLRIIWGALLGSQVMYGLVLKFLISQSEAPFDAANPFLVPVFNSMAILLIFLAFFVQKFLLKEAKKQLHVKFGAVDLSKLNISDLIGAFFSPCILRLALFEAVALFGFSLAFINKDLNYYMPFVSASMVGYFFNFPTEEKIRNAFKA